MTRLTLLIFKKTLFLFWRYVATTKNVLSRLLKFCSILFHFALFSFYSTRSLKNNDTNTMNFNDLDKSSWKCLWTKFTWVLKRCQIQATFIMTTCNATQNSAVLGYFWTSIFTEHLIWVNWFFGFHTNNTKHVNWWMKIWRNIFYNSTVYKNISLKCAEHLLVN